MSTSKTLIKGYTNWSNSVVQLVASSSLVLPEVLECMNSPLMNITMEGYPGSRRHSGSEWADEVEIYSNKQFEKTYGAIHVNTQSLSCTASNHGLITYLLKPHDSILSMNMSGCSRSTFVSKNYQCHSYGVKSDGSIDYEMIEKMAEMYNPKIIVAGSSDYPRQFDYARFREIANHIKAYLIADITQVSGLIATGRHPTPIGHAHFVTMSTYKQLKGPHGGCIMTGEKDEEIHRIINDAIFPHYQSTSCFSSMLGKGIAAANARTTQFHDLTGNIVDYAEIMADMFREKGYSIVTGGTDNHIVLIDIFKSKSITGYQAEKALEECGIITNRNTVPNDPLGASITSGIRLATNIVAETYTDEMVISLINLIDHILCRIIPRSGGKTYHLDNAVIESSKFVVKNSFV